MISLYDGQLTDLLGPNFRQDVEVQALSHALREGMRLLLKYKERALVYASIDTMPEAALDLLATECRTQYYDASFDIETKRELVKNTVRWFQIAGTPAAVEELAKKIFGECHVEEWDEYGGSPYYFRIITNAPASADDVAKFNDLLRKVKNLRSHLESVSILRSIYTQGNHSVSIRVTVTALPEIRCVS